MSSQIDTIIKAYKAPLDPLRRGASPKADPLSLFQRLVNGDHTSAAECVTAYGSYVWTLAKKNLPSTADAEKVSEEIFTDIWDFAKTGRTYDGCPDADTVRRIAVRRIIKHRFESRNIV